ncbi:MAG: diaminopimelate epimerase [Flavobacteriaceae bacterium]|nr:diaminopimelate epimerase [Flavobacteriaceae bacterium]
MIDDRNRQFPRTDHELVAQLCNRRFGVGADGLILLSKHPTEDFEMIYFNADGYLGSFCGNGGRCIVAFAKQLGIIQEQTQFMAADGLHRAKISNDQVSLHMNEVDHWKIEDDSIFMDTGSPHHVIFKDDISSVDVAKDGSEIAHNEPYGAEGTNVNFVNIRSAHQIDVRTFERGVEAETLSCGTGVTASAIATFLANKTTQTQLKVHTLGGVLEVDFNHQESQFTDVILRGPAQKVFFGTIEL